MLKPRRKALDDVGAVFGLIAGLCWSRSAHGLHLQKSLIGGSFSEGTSMLKSVNTQQATSKKKWSRII